MQQDSSRTARTIMFDAYPHMDCPAIVLPVRENWPGNTSYVAYTYPTHTLKPGLQLPYTWPTFALELP